MALKKRMLATAREAGQITMLWMETMRYGFSRPHEWNALRHQLDELGAKSLPIVLVASFFVGMVMAIQVAYSEANFAGRAMLGVGVGVAITKEFGPLLTALLVGGRVSAGITSVIGSMRVTEQVDAIRLLGASPAKKLVFPRVFATMIMMPLLTALADIVGIAGGLVVALLDLKMTLITYYYQVVRAVSMLDFFGGIFKAVVFGFFISLIGCHHGLHVEGGAEGVGQATTKSVVAASVCVMVADFFLTKLLLLIF